MPRDVVDEMRRLWAEAFNGRDVSLFDELMTDDDVDHHERRSGAGAMGVPRPHGPLIDRTGPELHVRAATAIGAR